jgi:hypothetical protein
MIIDTKLLDECPVLSDYEKDLIRRIDINHETQASVARFYKKSPSTISIQHKKAIEKFSTWLKGKGQQEKTHREEDFDKQAFAMFNKGLPPNKVIVELGNADRVFKLWKKHRELMDDDYCLALDIVVPWIRMSGNLKYPLAARVAKLRNDEFGCSLDMMFIWNLLEENGLTQGIDKDEDCAAYFAVERLINQTKKIRPSSLVQTK